MFFTDFRQPGSQKGQKRAKEQKAILSSRKAAAVRGDNSRFYEQLGGNLHLRKITSLSRLVSKGLTFLEPYQEKKKTGK